MRYRRRMDELIEHKLDKLTREIDDLRVLIKGIMSELRSIDKQIAGLPRTKEVQVQPPTPGTIGAQNMSIHELVKGHRLT